MKEVTCYLLSSLPVFVIGWIAISFAFTPVLLEVFLVFLWYFALVVFFGVQFMNLDTPKKWVSTISTLLPLWKQLVFYWAVYFYWILIELAALLFLLAQQEKMPVLFVGALAVYGIAVIIGKRVSRKIRANCPPC